MNDSIPNTVCCLLCRGTIIYKDGDKTRFKAHMNNEHGAFFDLDYLLASSMMEQDQKDTVARTIKPGPGAGLPSYQEYQGHPGTSSFDQETLRETTHTDVGYAGVGVNSSSYQVPSNLKRDRLEYETELLQTELNKMGGCYPLPPNQPNIKKEDAHDNLVSNYNNDTDHASYQQYSTDETNYENSSIIDANAEPNQQDAMNVANEVSMKEDDLDTEKKERFYCQFEGCEKSYSNSANRLTHQRKAHGLVGPRAAKKQKMSVSSIPEDEIAPSPSVVPGEPLEDINDDSPSIADDNSTGSFLTDTSLGFDESTDVENDNNDVFKTDEATEDVQTSTVIETEKTETAQAIDLSSSKYFDKNPKVIATARGKSLLLFDEIPEGLPSGWKQRNFEVTSKQTGDKSILKHYLAPEQKVLKTGLAVVEYLRVKGDLDHDALVDIAKKLNIADKKFKSLFT